MKLSVKTLWMLVTVTLAGCNQTPSTLEDTEGRVFETACMANACELRQISGPLSKPQRLVRDSRVMVVCEKDSRTARREPRRCRPLTCDSDRECPLTADSSMLGSCRRGYCEDARIPLATVDAVPRRLDFGPLRPFRHTWRPRNEGWGTIIPPSLPLPRGCTPNPSQQTQRLTPLQLST